MTQILDLVAQLNAHGLSVLFTPCTVQVHRLADEREVTSSTERALGPASISPESVADFLDAMVADQEVRAGAEEWKDITDAADLLTTLGIASDIALKCAFFAFEPAEK